MFKSIARSRPLKFALVVTGIFASPIAEADTLVASGTAPNGHIYQVWRASQGITWDYARQMALLQGGHLATISDAAENNFIYALIAPNSATLYAPDPTNQLGPWLGGLKVGGNFTWIDGTPFSYTNFQPGQPDNYLGDETALHWLAMGTDPVDQPGEGNGWNDLAPYNTVPGYVVEIDNAVPEAGVWAMMIAGFGLAGGVIRRRHREAAAA